MYLIGPILEMMLKIKMSASLPMIEPRLSICIVILGTVSQYLVKFSSNASLLKSLGSQETVITISDEVYC
jgi:hypothetical protein